MKTPFIGQAYVAKSPNLADNKLINLYPSLAPVQSGEAKSVGAFYLTPGLTLQCVCGSGPVRGMGTLFRGPGTSPVLYVVSGNQVYSVTTNYVVTLLGIIGTSLGPVSIIQNGEQLVIFDGIQGYLVPGGSPLTGGTIASGGAEYAVGDEVILVNSDGGTSATAEILVTSEISGVITGFTIKLEGAFSPSPTAFTQASTTGSGSGFVLSSPTYGAASGLYQLTLPFSGPVSAAYQDGFGLVNVVNTNQWYQSNLFDLSVWDDLNFSSADSTPSDVVAIFDIHEQLFLLKRTDTEVWVNSGLTGFAFQRLEGVHIENGIAAPFSIAKAGEAMIWVSRNSQGQGYVVAAAGYTPERISTAAIEYAISTYPSISDAISYTYLQQGHLFYVVTFPSGNATWVYDITTKMWHQRAAFINGQFNRHWSNCYANFNNQPLVGDYLTGNIYLIDSSNQTDNGQQRKWVRSWRALQEPSFVPVTFSSLQIDMETGIFVPPETNPQVVLRWTDDGGHIWSDERFQSAGKTGQTAQRVMFRRLGSTRFNHGLDRVFELSSTDQFKVALLGADLQ